MSVLVAFHVKGSGVTPKAPTLSPSVAAGRPLRRFVPVLKQCFQSFWVLRTASKQASIKDLENKHNASSCSARISFFFFFLLPCHVTVCRLTCHVVLGGSYQEAVQTKPGFPGSASNTANTLCSDTGALRETHWTWRKIRAITVAGHVCGSGVSFANLVFKVNISHGL